jgi:haloalkane dehalogenase
VTLLRRGQAPAVRSGGGVREDRGIAVFPDYPFAPHWLDVDGLRMHYVDEGTGPPVLLLHGEPTWSFLWRKIIPPLVASGRRAVAPDLLGFGLSDKPGDMAWYSYDRHVASIVRLVEELDLHHLTLVLHDWGGPIGLRVAVEHEDRVERLVILDTGIGGGSAPSETWLRFRDAVRRLGTELRPERLVEAGTAQELPDEVRDAYAAPFPTPESLAGARAFPELVPAEPDHPNTVPMNAVRDALRSWTKPALVVWGADDAALPAALAQRFVDLIPGATGPVLIEGASHFLQEDRPVEVTQAILDFLA